MNLVRAIFILSLTFFVVSGVSAQNFNKRKYRPRFASPKQQHRAQKQSAKENNTTHYENATSPKKEVKNAKEEGSKRVTNGTAVTSFVLFAAGVLAIAALAMSFWTIDLGAALGLILIGLVGLIAGYILSWVSIGQMAKSYDQYNVVSGILAGIVAVVGTAAILLTIAGLL